MTNSQKAEAIPLQRVRNISEEDFKLKYLKKNIPLIIEGELESWDAKKTWNLNYLAAHFGEQQVQIYGNLFDLHKIISLKEYVETYCNKALANATEFVPYIRWYTRLKDYDFEWSDPFFKKIEKLWSLPSFMPKTDYLLPFVSSPQVIDPVHDNFPAKAIFISGSGAKTSLHEDPWGSDAILCQIYGTKRVELYSPTQKQYLVNNTHVVDTDRPNLKEFPNYPQASLTYIDILKPGEIIFIPHGWFHKVDTISDSISITWNFVHISTWPYFFEYLIDNISNIQELEIIKFFISKRASITG